MKTNHKLSGFHLRALTLAMSFILSPTGQVVAQPANGNPAVNSSLTNNEIINAIILDNNKPGPFQGVGEMDHLFEQATKERNETVRKLLGIFHDNKSSIESKGYAAYYLGQLHAAEAADSLAAEITLSFPLTRHMYFDEAEWRGYAALNALVSIGPHAIPAVIRNLEESDDGKVRTFSLETLWRIDGDKDVVQLRLKKDLEAQKDVAKKARLEAAIKSLPTISNFF